MDNRILQILYEKNYQEIFLYLLSLSHDSLLAEDLVQETFLKAILSLDEKHPNIRAWLYRVARNLYFNEKKKLDRNVLTDSFDENIKDEKADSLLEKLIDSQTKKNLYEAMQHINARQREVLTLQYFGNFKQKEIAKLLKITPENVRILSHRGKIELKKYMEDCHEV